MATSKLVIYDDPPTIEDPDWSGIPAGAVSESRLPVGINTNFIRPRAHASTLRSMDPTVQALTQQTAETASLVDGLSGSKWNTLTRCEGWRISDVVLHLAQSDEMAIASLNGRFPVETADRTGGWGGASSVDESVALMVDRERGAPIDELLERWRSGAGNLIAVLSSLDLSTRVLWVAGHLSARTLATTRLAETWIHTGDIADALGVELVATDRIKPIARLAWRTLPYAFGSVGQTLSGPVAFRLVSPSGDLWTFLPDEPAVTTIEGPAAELCAVAARRTDPETTSLRGEGPDVDAVLALVRTYA